MSHTQAYCQAVTKRATRGRRLVTREDWADAALAALGERGLAGVAVEPLARALGVTKGSFYWHFKDRRELVAAALARWEAVAVDDPIAALAGVDDPAERLRRLVAIAWERPEHLRAEQTLAAASEPEIAGVVARVTARRLEFLVQAYRELGEPPARARQWAATAMATYLGTGLLLRAAPEVAPTDAAFRALVRHFAATLLPASSR
nr:MULTISPECIES: TetR/AcrR family transcriptional regulator [unclassified Nannocystis]